MNKILSNSKAIILLTVILAAGLLWYIPQKKEPILLDNRFPSKGPIADKQVKIRGTVVKYGSNREGDVDKVLLSSNEKQVWLHFPPHTAKLVATVAVINEQVEALAKQRGPLHKENQGEVYELKFMSNNVLQTKVNLEDIPAPAPKKGIEIEIEGIPSLHSNENTFLLSGKMVTLPPHMARELFPLINQAKIITVKGFMRDSTDGFLSESGLPVVKPISIKINSVIYKIR